jgi:saccharopine dehydrogenase (NAD+, L-lysine-forming)
MSGEIVVVGGYGNAGRKIVELLLVHTDRRIVIGGRSRARAEALVAELQSPRLRGESIDATDPASLARALDHAELLIVAAGTSANWHTTAEASLAARCHQLDIQIGSAKNAGLRALGAQARKRGVCIVTDCGFHPGVPAAMVRAHPELTTAVVNSWIAVDWAALGEFSQSTVDEMLQEFTDYRYEAFVDGRWTTATGMRTAYFPSPVGRQKVAAMGLDEMHELTASRPDLRETGFYVGGFPTEVNYGVIPLVYAGMRLLPGTAKALGHLLDSSLRRFSHPPYVTHLQLDSGPRTVMRLTHTDAYLLTAAPVVAATKQVLDGAESGVHLQAMLVEPTVFFTDLQAMGVQLWP